MGECKSSPSLLRLPCSVHSLILSTAVSHLSVVRELSGISRRLSQSLPQSLHIKALLGAVSRVTPTLCLGFALLHHAAPCTSSTLSALSASDSRTSPLPPYRRRGE